jgi:hypothetical protein
MGILLAGQTIILCQIILIAIINIAIIKKEMNEPPCGKSEISNYPYTE